MLSTTYHMTECVSSHMTLFGAGFFVQPNTVDFKFIYAEADFLVVSLNNVQCVISIFRTIYLYMLQY